MKEMKKSDQVWCILLIVMPVLALLIGLVPGSIRIYDPQTEVTNSYFLLTGMPGSVMDTTAPLLLVAPVYVLILAVCYIRGQKLNTLKAVMIFSVPAAAIAWIPVLLEANLFFWPYGLIPILLTIEWVASYIYFKIQDAKYEY